MSAAKMVADSTQDASDGKKKKRKMKKSGKKVSLPEDEDSDLDLKKDLKPISFYSKERPKMIDEMFQTVKGASLQRALPELLKTIPIEELKLLCLEQLEVMSKKRIRRILSGEESANISSSGTDDDSSEEENVEGKCQDLDVSDKTLEEGTAADSTSVHQENAQKGELEAEQAQVNNGSQPQPQTSSEFLPAIEIKQEPPDSEPEPEEEYEQEQEEDDMEQEEEEEEEEDDDDEEEFEDDPPEAYTSGSEDGELVKKDTVMKDIGAVEIKQEVLSDTENQGQGEDMESENDPVDGHAKTSASDNQNVEELEGELLSSVETGNAESGNLVLPSIMMDQMELLELEMRARAIKAMLTSHEEEPDDG